MHPNAIDLTGQRFGRLQVLRPNGKIRGGIAWECACDCGNRKTVDGSSLRHGTAPVRSCGCLRRYAARVDHEGKRYGRWVALRRDMSRAGSFWICRCDCGTEKSVATSSLQTGGTTSCGCRNKERCRSKQKEYFIWKAMLSRCENPDGHAYARYGGRGIAVCGAWHDFDTFLRDVGPRPSLAHSLDRIDPNGNYEPGNVRWSDWKTQANNRALSESRVTRVLNDVESAISAGEYSDAREALTLIRRALLGV